MVEKVGWFQNSLPNPREYCKIDVIMALHTLKFDGHKIVLRDLTCSKCSIDGFWDGCETFFFFPIFPFDLPENRKPKVF